jgi:4-hydroxybenzoate polyprenyltransferase
MLSAVKIQKYLSLVKFAHSIFAMPFALTGFALATFNYSENVNYKLLILVILCMIFARNAAMSFNRWIDRNFDKLNPRTAMREIPAELIKPGSALTFSIINGMLFIVATWFINELCFYLSPVALLVILGYSVTKRFTSLSHFILGLGLSLAPIGAYLAISGVFDPAPVVLSVAVLFWVSGFDVMYSLQDESFDREIKLKSVPVMLGAKNSLILSFLTHLVSAALLFWFGLLIEGTIIYWIGFAIFTALLFYQHLIVKPSDLSRMNLAFFTLNGIASILFATITILDMAFAR